MIDLNKPIETVDGKRRIEVVRTNIDEPDSDDPGDVLVMIWNGKHHRYPGVILSGTCMLHTADSNHTDAATLVRNVPKRIKRTAWLNVYPNPQDGDMVRLSKARADECAGHQRIACIPIEIDCEEGEGL